MASETEGKPKGGALEAKGRSASGRKERSAGLNTTERTQVHCRY